MISVQQLPSLVEIVQLESKRSQYHQEGSELKQKLHSLNNEIVDLASIISTEATASLNTRRLEAYKSMLENSQQHLKNVDSYISESRDQTDKQYWLDEKQKLEKKIQETKHSIEQLSGQSVNAQPLSKAQAEVQLNLKRTEAQQIQSRLSELEGQIRNLEFEISCQYHRRTQALVELLINKL